jgi:hypothetical protein
MSEPHDHPSESSAPPRRRWGCLLVCLLVAGLVVLGTLIFLGARGDRALRDAVAEADAQDPDWRLMPLEEKRVQPPDPINSALQVQVAKRLMPGGWGGAPSYYELFQEMAPEAQLNAQQTAALKAELQKAAKALEEARKLAEMRDGNVTITYSPDFFGTLLPTVQDTRQVVNLLKDDAFLRAQEKDADGAARSLQAAVNGGRSIGDGPMAVCQLVRIACVAVGMMNLERLLAQGEPSPKALAELQRLLEEEDRFPYLLVMCRGERAGSDQFMTWLESGNANAKYIGGLSGGSGPGDRGLALLLRVPGEIKWEHAAMLHYMNQMVEAAKLPEAQQMQRFHEIEGTVRQLPPLARLMAPAMGKVADAAQRTHAQLRCAIVMLAAERYRQQKNRWPASIQALVDEGYLKEVPADPYDGAAIRFKRVPDGFVIYSTGPDKQDDGGHFDRQKFLAKGTDLGFRLWDVDKRRQPPLPPKPAQPSPAMEGMPGEAPPGPGAEPTPPAQGP